jgi:hypothetical protein
MRIDANRIAMRRSAARVNFTLGLAGLGVVAGALTFIFVQISPGL